MAKTYTGNLSLEWYYKQKSLLQLSAEDSFSGKDIPAPLINWVNKDEGLFYEINDEVGRGLKPYWVERNDIRVKEARPLLLQKVFKSVSKDKEGTIPGTSQYWQVTESTKEEEDVENMLIKGDNLLALNSIRKLLDNKLETERIKCIYIDPPFNTGQAFDYYDDNLERSEWLTMLRDRIVILKSFLREDGFILIHLDESEVHYCKVLMDEIMGASNFISHITYERSGVAGLGQGGFLVNTTEHILLYRNIKPPIGNNIGSYALDENTIRRYNRILKNTGNTKLVDEFISKSNKMPVKIFRHRDYEIETISLSNFKEREPEIRRIYAKNLNKLFRGNQVQKENSFQNGLIDKMDKDCLYSVEYTPSRGKFKDEKTTLYYYNKELLSWLGDNASVDGDDIVKSLKLTTLWNHSDIPKADIANEGGIDFPRGKKPENLIKRIFDLCTNEGDLILDCFAGSGTSLAVAHKMKRKWIGVEIGNHADSHIIPRIKSVISGKDQLGISKKMDWQGGGSFKYYHLGPSIIKINKDGTGDFNWSLGKKFIEESFLLSYDYTIDNMINLSADKLFSDSENQPVIGIQRIGSKNRVAIVTLNEPKGKLGNITYDELHVLYKTVRKKYSPEYINIFTNRGIEIAFDSKPEDLEVIKVPSAIFAELEK